MPMSLSAILFWVLLVLAFIAIVAGHWGWAWWPFGSAVLILVLVLLLGLHVFPPRW